jgi:hypothetical protein
VIARAPFKRRMSVAVAKPDRSDEFASFNARPVGNAVMATAASIAGSRPSSPAIPAKLSQGPHRSGHPRRSARRALHDPPGGDLQRRPGHIRVGALARHRRRPRHGDQGTRHLRRRRLFFLP